MYQHKKLFIGSVCSAILIGTLLHDPLSFIAYAQDAPVNAHTNSFINSMVEAMSFIDQIVQFVSYIALKFLAFLLDPEAIFSIDEATRDGDTSLLLRVWQYSRDIMNVIFAFLLVIAAIYTVVTAKQELIKENITKFVLAVVLVNFSWFFPRIILDVANVLTATVYQIPSTFGAQCIRFDEKGEREPCKYIKNVYLFYDEVGSDGKKADGFDICQRAATTQDIETPIPGVICTEIGELDSDSNTSLGVLHGLYVNFVRFTELSKITIRSVDESAPIRGFLKWAIQFAFQLIVIIGATFPLVALTAAFFIRIPIIWLTTAFMPFMFLGFILGDKLNFGEGNTNTMEIFKKFTKAAFLPTVVAIPFTIGFIMLNAGMQSACPPGSGLCANQVFILPGINQLWALLWNFMAVFVIWVGVFSALSIDNYYNSIGNAVKSTGEKWLSFIPKGLLAAPIIPTPDGKTSLAAETAGARALLKDPNIALDRFGRFRPDFKKNVLGVGDEKSGNIESVVRDSIASNLPKGQGFDASKSGAFIEKLVQEMKKKNVGKDDLTGVIEEIKRQTADRKGTSGEISQTNLDEIRTQITAKLNEAGGAGSGGSDSGGSTP